VLERVGDANEQFAAGDDGKLIVSTTAVAGKAR
jgi:hypothetical protein